MIPLFHFVTLFCPNPQQQFSTLISSGSVRPRALLTISRQKSADAAIFSNKKEKKWNDRRYSVAVASRSRKSCPYSLHVKIKLVSGWLYFLFLFTQSVPNFPLKLSFPTSPNRDKPSFFSLFNLSNWGLIFILLTFGISASTVLTPLIDAGDSGFNGTLFEVPQQVRHPSISEMSQLSNDLTHSIPDLTPYQDEDKFVLIIKLD